MVSIQKTAMDFMHRNDHNFYAIDLKVRLRIFENEVDVESIWYSDKEDKIYIHVGCFEFKGDLDIDSLSSENRKILQDAMNSRI